MCRDPIRMPLHFFVSLKYCNWIFRLELASSEHFVISRSTKSYPRCIIQGNKSHRTVVGRRHNRTGDTVLKAVLSPDTVARTGLLMLSSRRRLSRIFIRSIGIMARLARVAINSIHAAQCLVTQAIRIIYLSTKRSSPVNEIASKLFTLLSLSLLFSLVPLAFSVPVWLRLA